MRHWQHYALAFLAATIVVPQLSAQERTPSRLASPISPIAVENSGSSATAKAKPDPELFSAPAALKLRGGATSTGLFGFYDYQSNGGSPKYIYVNPTNPDEIYVTYMNSTDPSSVTAINASRHVGYAYSSDGGKTWTSTRAIDEAKLGYPVIQATSTFPLIATHGGPESALQVMVYGTSGPADVENFFQYVSFPVQTASGRSGTIWPGFTLTNDMATGVVVATHSPGDNEQPGPLQVGSFDVESGSASAEWRELGDSVSTMSSGGRHVVARSASGKIGVAWFRYSLGNTTPDPNTGIYFSESTDNGATWSEPTKVLAGDNIISDITGDEVADTVSPGSNVDLTYIGEEPHVVFTGGMNSLLQFQNILHWSPSRNAQMIVLTNMKPGLGAFSMEPTLRQANMGSIAYPTIASTEDGQHVVVVFQAVDQRLNEARDSVVVDVVDSEGFSYFRIWGIGSADGGRTWGEPFIIQDYAGTGSDSASLTYPSISNRLRATSGGYNLDLVFQARRHAGTYAYTSPKNEDGTTEAQKVGTIEEATQYFQRFLVTPAMFPAPSSTREVASESAAMSIAGSYPSPASGRTRIEYTLPRAGTATLRIVNTLGADAIEPIAHYGVTGVQSRTIDLSSLSSGAYRIVVEQSGRIVSAPLMIAR